MANAPVFRRDQYSDLYGENMLPVLEEIFRFEMEQEAPVVRQLFKTVQTERDIWQSTEMHDLELFSEIPEGSEYSFVRGKQGASKTLKPAKFGLGFSISEEAIEDGKFDMVSDHIAKLGRSGTETMEIQAANIFNNGFSSETTADGSSVFNTSHSLPSGGSYRNRLSTDADLSVTSLDTALSDFRTEFVGDSGIVYRKRPRTLLVHPDNEATALELVNSQLKPDTSDNNINSFRNRAQLDVVVSPHLTDADAWFLLADPMDTGLRIVSRKGMETKVAGPDVGFTTDSMLWKARYREKIGVTHGYGVFGTSGAS